MISKTIGFFGVLTTFSGPKPFVVFMALVFIAEGWWFDLPLPSLIEGWFSPWFFFAETSGVVEQLNTHLVFVVTHQIC